MNWLKSMKAAYFVAAALQGAVIAHQAIAQEATPGYNNKIPESLLTPDKLETRVGTLDFFDGIPTKETFLTREIGCAYIEIDYP